MKTCNYICILHSLFCFCQGGMQLSRTLDSCLWRFCLSPVYSRRVGVETGSFGGERWLISPYPSIASSSTMSLLGPAPALLLVQILLLLQIQGERVGRFEKEWTGSGVTIAARSIPPATSLSYPSSLSAQFTSPRCLSLSDRCSGVHWQGCGTACSGSTCKMATDRVRNSSLFCCCKLLRAIQPNPMLLTVPGK